MNYSVLRYTVGKILRVVSALMALPLIISFLYHESAQQKLAFVFTILLTYGFGLALSLRKPKDNHYFAREGLAIVCITWFLLSFFGGLPFFFSREIPHLLDCFFESASGFTTTGASIIPQIEELSHSMLFWRSFTHLIGGMGVLVFTLAVMPKASHDTVHIMKAEVPGPSFEKLLSKVRDNARILYAIYLSMTAVLVIVLLICGMPLFDAFIHAFGAAGTGGFGIKSNSVG
ncbi:MAG TPA: TrkH family potassium uptake protein, partial [Clostridiaceae bacterium]|nr:TrkH family potassium uptake protein [Clostridiaceae bacterium]